MKQPSGPVTRDPRFPEVAIVETIEVGKRCPHCGRTWAANIRARNVLRHTVRVRKIVSVFGSGLADVPCPGSREEWRSTVDRRELWNGRMPTWVNA